MYHDAVFLFRLEIDPSSPVWVGGWWMGFLFTGSVCLLVSAWIIGLPSKLPGKGKDIKGKDISVTAGSWRCTAFFILTEQLLFYLKTCTILRKEVLIVVTTSIVLCQPRPYKQCENRMQQELPLLSVKIKPRWLIYPWSINSMHPVLTFDESSAKQSLMRCK